MSQKRVTLQQGPFEIDTIKPNERGREGAFIGIGETFLVGPVLTWTWNGQQDWGRGHLLLGDASYIKGEVEGERAHIRMYVGQVKVEPA